MSLSPPSQAKRRKIDESASKKYPDGVPLTLSSFLTDVFWFHPDIAATLAKFGVTSFGHLTLLREDYLAKWFDKPCQTVILCSLQRLRRFLELDGDPKGVTDSLDLGVQTARLVRATDSAPVPTVVDSSSSHISAMYKTTEDRIGLELWDGRIFYCHRLTLTNAGGYFAARFGGYIPAGAESRDGHGRSIYFIERDSKLFEQHILPYIVTGCPGKLPRFSQDPELWRLLREEAVFYGLDGLSEMLNVTYKCVYEADNDRGILYWLGTDKGMCVYRNPHATGAVRVKGWVDMPRQEIKVRRDEKAGLWKLQAYKESSPQALVQYRPPVKGVSAPGFCFCARDGCFSMWCGYSSHRIPTIIDLQSISVRLTAYSLRYDRCGMSYWNLEASEDGSKWDVLHEARNDRYLCSPPVAQLSRFKEKVIDNSKLSENEKSVYLLSYVERNHRHTWKIDPEPTVFYRFFRLIGLGADMPEGNMKRCMHGVGLELYGDVHEV